MANGSGATLKRWSWSSWSRAVILPALLGGGELAWAYLWLAWFCALPFAGFTRTAMSWPAAALVLALAIGATRLAFRWGLSDRQSAAALLTAGVAVVLLVTWLEHGRHAPQPADLVHLPDRIGSAGAANVAALFGAYLWWRGIAIARNPLHFDDASVRFIFGLAALTGALALTGMSGSSLNRVTTALLALQFFACSLIALALTRLEDIRGESAGDSAGLGLSREWVGVLLLTVAGILVLSLVLTATASADVARALSAALNLAADGLILVVYAIALPIGVLVALFVYALRALVRLLGGGQQEPFQPPPALTDLRDQVQQGNAHHLPAVLLTAGKWALLVLVVGVVATVIVRAVFRYRSRRGLDIEEIHESIWPGGSALSALWAWLLALLSRLRPRPPIVAPVEPAYAGEPADPDVRTVREVYRAWLTAAEALGQPRPAQQTAAEFLATGQRLVPDAALELARLTEVYETARYGPPPLPHTETDTARAAWLVIRRRLPEQRERGGEA